MPVIVENTHPALATKEQWDIVQNLRKQKKRIPKQMEAPNIFSGITFCADCRRSMVLHRASTMKQANYNFKCYTYGKRGRAECIPHHIQEEELHEIMLDDLRRVTHIARMKERQFAEYIMGRITNEQFRLLSGDYNAEQNGLDETIPQKEERLEKLTSSANNVNAFIEKAKKYKSIDVLTPEIVRLFIARIEIGERSKKYSRFSTQKIRIVYRDIGEWDQAAETEG